MVRVDIVVPDPAGALAAAAFAPGALIRVERAPAVGGPFAEVFTVAIVQTTTFYQPWDATGGAGDWYRWRISNAANTAASPYAAPFRGSSPTATEQTYATLADVVKLYENRPEKPARLERLQSLLLVATREMVEAAGRDYFRHPADGDEVFYAQGDGSGTLHVHEGVVSVTSVEVQWGDSTTYRTIEPTDYVLRGADPNRDEPIVSGEPYFHLTFTGWGSDRYWPRATTRAVKLTGAHGWAAPPARLVEATAERVRQLDSMDASYSGSQRGPDDYGKPSPFTPLPDLLWRFLDDERHRFWCHL